MWVTTMSKFFDKAYYLTAGDVISNLFDGWDADDQFDDEVKRIEKIVKFLHSSDNKCIAVILTDDDYDLLPSTNSNTVEPFKKYECSIVNYAGIVCIEESFGWNYRVWFADTNEAETYFNIVEAKLLQADDLSEDMSSPKELAKRVQNDDLDYDDDIDAKYAKDDEYEIQLQDRESRSIGFNKDFKKLDKQPKVQSKTWARVWKNGKLIRSIEGSKYGARNDLVKYLNSDEPIYYGEDENA